MGDDPRDDGGDGDDPDPDGGDADPEAQHGPAPISLGHDRADGRQPGDDPRHVVQPPDALRDPPRLDAVDDRRHVDQERRGVARQLRRQALVRLLGRRGEDVEHLAELEEGLVGVALEHGAVDVGHGGAEDVPEPVGLLDVLDDRHERRAVGRERRDAGVDEAVGDLARRGACARPASRGRSSPGRRTRRTRTGCAPSTTPAPRRTAPPRRGRRAPGPRCDEPPPQQPGTTMADDARRDGSASAYVRLAEVDGNRTRRTGIARPNRFEGGGAHQVPGHLPGDRRSSTTRGRRRPRRRRARRTSGTTGGSRSGCRRRGGRVDRRGPRARRPTRRGWRWRRRGGGRGR